MSLTLTAEGKEKLAEMAAEVDEVESTLGGVLEPGQLPELASILRRCAVAVEDEVTQLRRRGG